MEIGFCNTAAGGVVACALLPLYERAADAAPDPLPARLFPWAAEHSGLRDFRGKEDERLLLYAPAGIAGAPAERVVLLGLGKRDKNGLKNLRNAVAGALKFCRERAFASVGLPLAALDALTAAGLETDTATLVRESAASALLGLYRGDICRGKGNEDEERPDDPVSFSFLFAGEDVPTALREAARTGAGEARGVILTRDLANTPGNRMYPAVLADEARKVAETYGFSCTVFDDEHILSTGMGALYAVGRGSRNGPRFAVLEHCPAGREQDRPLIVAGKGITFDSGGISLKPSASMHEMKSDMAGAAAVLGLFTALGEAPDRDALPRVVGLIAAAENMPGGRATRPGDVVTALNGNTVEIQNTDAEGRLALCDALVYAQKEYAPALLIDLATLTGACVIALGDYGSGLFTEDTALRAAVQAAAEQAGDLVWPMPLWDDYDKNLKSEIADMSNIGPREGGAVHAALFLRRFIEKGTRWAHLDIAGPGWVSKPSPLHPAPGATGVGVRLLCRLLRHPGLLEHTAESAPPAAPPDPLPATPGLALSASQA
ncbi:MAG: leucyl aminopeptidase [Desulfovibrio sp.]|nr:leucyl aminopeptidase [Desulfovibrio sp.]